ncbi:2-(3-amino-3-carboxypropyl)histidine synthase subunit 2-like [Mercenaria mercenaria]|uniref:2-(3-amino-3-carboxypropyl)histidine synthase subunit 2-like n=1 Tax=Mercenaria mercenaria TaxID=6596 RepID=UPI00234F40A7|nr:2-(3-amino-3-carboxypropyl)histidine synthase subunit 2-like [Mercenaria mercenaria]
MMEGTSAFYTGSEEAIKRQVSAVGLQTEESQIDDVYEIQHCVDWIKQAGFKRVALQFPDDLMQDAVSVTTRLEAMVPSTCKVFILGDTSYGSCCVDEVAAQHYNADAMIHYGRSCLSQPVKMSVLFVYGRLPLDVDNCVHQFSILYPDTSSHVVIVYDTVYAYACDEIKNRLRCKYENCVMSMLKTRDTNVDLPGDLTVITKCGRTLGLPAGKTLSDYTMFYIGSESLTLSNLIYNFQSNQFFSYNPSTREGRRENVNVNKILMKRYFMIEKAKDARIVGILVGTLGVANYTAILNRLKVLIEKAGKKSYVFIVGKINVAKLANFMEIDVFVVIACAENTLLDSSEFYKPVITPYEMELACNTEREWTGEYPTDFNQLLHDGSHHQAIPDTVHHEEGDVSLVTGKIRTLGYQDNNVETGTAVVLRSDAMTVATQADSAGEYLSMRSWQGLEQKLGETPVTMAVEGQKGIAMGYSDEPS